MNVHALTRRDFIKRSTVLAGAFATAGRLPAWADDPVLQPSPTRFVFLTDAHLMVDGAFGSDKGVAACLDAVEALRPRPEFILCGGDLTHESPHLDFAGGTRLIDRFLGIWRDHTSLPAHFTFGNHDFAGSQHSGAAHDDPRFGKGLWRQRLGLERTFYGFDAGGWRVVVLDDVGLNPDGSYVGEFAEDQFTFLKGELAAAGGRPMILGGHIPAVSVLPTVTGFAKLVGAKIETPTTLVATNTKPLLDMIKLAGGNLKLVLAGHLHHFEQVDLDGIRFINSGAVCGDWWRGPQLGCPEGFLVVDLQPDGRFSHVYQSYNWKAAAHQGV